MSRSVKKGPFVEAKLFARIEAMNASGEKRVLKTWSRASTIFPQFVGHTIAVHDGRKHVLPQELSKVIRVQRHRTANIINNARIKASAN